MMPGVATRKMPTRKPSTTVVRATPSSAKYLGFPALRRVPRPEASHHLGVTVPRGTALQTTLSRSGDGESDLRLSTPSPPSEEEEDLDLTDPEPAKPGVDEIKKRLYTRECTRLGVTPVGAFLRAPTRTELQIPHYSLGPHGARALSVPLMLDSTLTSLDLEGNALGPEGLANLREMLLEHCAITQLNLKRNNLGDKGALVICQVLQKNRLITSLNVSANNFEDKAGIFFANMLKANNQLKVLDLSDNRLAEISGRQLGSALSHNETLESLDLCWNHFSGNGAIKLMEGVAENIGLKHLRLAYNGFGRGRNDKSPTYLEELLSSNSALLSLDLSGNRLLDLDVLMTAKGLRDNETLQTLKIAHNLVGVSAGKALLASLVANEASRVLLLDMSDLPISEDDLIKVEELRLRGVKVMHGRVHQTETDFEAEPVPNQRKTDSADDDKRSPSAEDNEEEAVTASATYVTTTDKPMTQE